MIRLLLRFATAAVSLPLLLVGLVALGYPGRASSQPVEWNQPMAPFRIVGNIYYVGTRGLGVYLITTPQGDFLLDGALPESARQIKQNVALLGFRMTDIRYLLNTHAHFDHAGGLLALKQVSGAEMVASRADKPDLESGLTESFGAGWDRRDKGVKVDKVVEDGEIISLGGTRLTAHLTPGHTRGCTTWGMPVQENGKTYQVVFYCSTSVPGYPLINNRLYPNIVSDYRHSFEVLRALPCDVFLANHSGFFHLQEKLAMRKPGAPNPFIHPGELQEVVADSQRDFEQELVKQTAAAHRSGSR